MQPRRLTEIESTLKQLDADWNSLFRELIEIRHPQALELLYSEISTGGGDRSLAARDCFALAVCQRSDVALRHTSYEIREVSLKIIGERREVRAIEDVSRILRNDAAEAMRELAAETLGLIGQEACVAGLQFATVDRIERIRIVVLEALKRLRFPSAERAIVEFLDDDQWSIREIAFEYLSNSGWEPTTHRQSVLQAILQGRFDEAIRYGEGSVQPLVNSALSVGNDDVRHWSAVTLAKLRSPAVQTKLREAARSTNEHTRKAAEEALAVVGQAAVVEEPVAEAEPIQILVPAEPARPFEEACELLATSLEL